jgi:hypothetical protein
MGLPNVTFAWTQGGTMHGILLKIKNARMLMKLGSSDLIFSGESGYVVGIDMQPTTKI